MKQITKKTSMLKIVLLFLLILPLFLPSFLSYDFVSAATEAPATEPPESEVTPTISSLATQSVILSTLVSQSQQLESRVLNVEEALHVTPAQAIAINNLENDVKSINLDLQAIKTNFNSLESNYKGEIESNRREVERLYSLIFWFLGAVISISIAIFGSNLIRKKPDFESRISKLEQEFNERPYPQQDELLNAVKELNKKLKVK